MPETTLSFPDWPLPPGVHAFVTTRHGGASKDPYATFNLGHHVGDDAEAVAQNRELLRSQLEQHTGCASLHLQWLQQVHGTAVRDVQTVAVEPPKADAAYTRQTGVVLSVLTADCLPVLYCSKDGKEIAVAHAGWRGLCNGVLEATLEKFNAAPRDIRCWLGPAIGPCHFEVGSEVRDAFRMLSRQTYMAATIAAFTPATQPAKWMGDLYALARIRLQAAGVADISGQAHCVVCDAANYYSYRQQTVTGRFATGIVKVPQ